MFDIVDSGKNLLRVERTRLHYRHVQQDRLERIAQHKQAVAARRAALMAKPGEPRGLNLFADGDSWFDYPLPLDGRNDVIRSIGKHGTPQPLILNLAHYGDEARDLLGVKRRQRIINNLKDPENGTFDAILFSGGGNDTVGEQFCLWIKEHEPGMTPDQAINEPRLEAVLGVVRSAYEDLIAIRDQIVPDCYIFIHAYDFAIPNSDGGICDGLIGPWLDPSLRYRDWTNTAEATGVVRVFLLRFHDLLENIAGAHKNVILVKTQGTLDPQTDWANELHPTPEGFDKIGAKFVEALQEVFQGRI